MTAERGLPPEIAELAKLIQRLSSKSYVTRAEMDTVRRAKLHIAFWACRIENLPVTRENLSYVMGSDANEMIAAYDKYMETRTDDARGADDKKKKAKPGGGFWDGA